MSAHGFTFCTCFHKGHCATCRERANARLEARKRKAEVLIEPARKLRARITGLQDTIDLLNGTMYKNTDVNAFLHAQLIILVNEEKKLTETLRPQLDAIYAEPEDEDA